MKKTICIIIAFVMVGGVATHVLAEVKVQQEKGVLVGEVIDLVNYAMYGRIGQEHIEESNYRAENGFPIGILEEKTGKVYVAVYRIPVPAAGLMTANTTLTPYMGKKVVVQGIKYNAPGLNMIRISAIGEY